MGNRVFRPVCRGSTPEVFFVPCWNPCAVERLLWDWRVPAHQREAHSGGAGSRPEAIITDESVASGWERRTVQPDNSRRSDKLPSLVDEKDCDDEDDDSCVPHRVWYDSPVTSANHVIHGIHHTPLDFDFHNPLLFRRHYPPTPSEDDFADSDVECMDNDSPTANEGIFSGMAYRLNLHGLRNVAIKESTLKLVWDPDAQREAARATLPHLQPGLKNGQEGMFCEDFFVEDIDGNMHWAVMGYYYQSSNPDHPYAGDEAFLESGGKGLEPRDQWN
ncbi:hypothetical protein N7512_004321 [Penicillium capsulatum]|nr:hypothetical protein N7512_004321 [Penicillium capsulatum]